MRVSVIIPLLNPGPGLSSLLQALWSQQPVVPEEVLLLDSGSTDGSLQGLEADPRIRIGQIQQFRHGAARNLGIQAAQGELVVFLTQDAEPAHPQWLAELLKPFSDPQVAATFSRQLPRPDCNPMEAHFLDTHFPAGPARRMQQRAGEPLRFQENLFFSNASSAIRRSAALEHPFEADLIMSEDQQLARDLLQAGQALFYCPESRVLHSHDYGFRSAMGRYMDSLISLQQIFPDHHVGRSLRMGGSYLGQELRQMLRHPAFLPRYISLVAGKTLGTLLGHASPRLPASLLQRISLHPYYWERDRAETQLRIAPPRSLC